MTSTTRDDTPLWLFADQLGPAVYGGEHAHREVLLVEATSALRKRRYHRQKRHLVLSALRHADEDLGDRAIDVQINRLRRKLEEDPAEPKYLQTMRGQGYRLLADPEHSG